MQALSRSSPEAAVFVPEQVARPSGARTLALLGGFVVALVAAMTLLLRTPREQPAVPAAAAAAPPPAVVEVAPAPAPAPTTTFVTVVSEPVGATLTWNGRVVGVAPATFELPPGKQTVVVVKDGYGAGQLDLFVPDQRGEPIVRSLLLKALAPSRGSSPSRTSVRPSPPPEPAPARVEEPAAARPSVRVIGDDPKPSVRVIE
jgi:hypothetical protein